MDVYDNETHNITVYLSATVTRHWAEVRMWQVEDYVQTNAKDINVYFYL